MDYFAATRVEDDLFADEFDTSALDQEVCSPVGICELPSVQAHVRLPESKLSGKMEEVQTAYTPNLETPRLEEADRSASQSPGRGLIKEQKKGQGKGKGMRTGAEKAPYKHYPRTRCGGRRNKNSKKESCSATNSIEEAKVDLGQIRSGSDVIKSPGSDNSPRIELRAGLAESRFACLMSPQNNQKPNESRSFEGKGGLAQSRFAGPTASLNKQRPYKLGNCVPEANREETSDKIKLKGGLAESRFARPFNSPRTRNPSSQRHARQGLPKPGNSIGTHRIMPKKNDGPDLPSPSVGQLDKARSGPEVTVKLPVSFLQKPMEQQIQLRRLLGMPTIDSKECPT